MGCEDHPFFQEISSNQNFMKSSIKEVYGKRLLFKNT
jgi:hypothetical protein